jgi:PAS domain-containing protein
MHCKPAASGLREVLSLAGAAAAHFLFLRKRKKQTAGPDAYAALAVFAAGWAAALIPALPEAALTAVVAALIAQFAMNLTSAVLVRHLRQENRQVRTAIDSMAQGLCMFDAAERLVVCNSQYSRMYELMPADVKPGSTLCPRR